MKSFNTIGFNSFIVILLNLLLSQANASNIKISNAFFSDIKQITIRLSGLYLVKDPSKIIDHMITCENIIIDFNIYNSDSELIKQSKCNGKVESYGGHYGVSEILITTEDNLKINGKYEIKHLKSETCIAKRCTTLEKNSIHTKLRKLFLKFNKRNTSEIAIRSNTNLDINFKYRITVTRNKKPIIFNKNKFKIIQNGNKNISVILSRRLRNKDSVTIETHDALGVIVGKATFIYSHPKSSEDALTYLSFSFDRDDNRDQQYQFAFKFKYDKSKDLARFNPDKFGKPSPVIDIDLNNKDKDAKQKATIKLLWSMYKSPLVNTKRNYNKQHYHSFGTGFEFEDNLKNNNFVTSYTFNKKNAQSNMYNASIGIDFGKNLRLTSKVDPTGGLDGYNISRFVLGLGYIYVKDDFNNPFFNSFTFSLSNKIRYLFSDEVHVKTIKGNDDDIEDMDEYYLDSGLREFWEAEALFGISDRVGVTLKYENGKAPQFYRDEDKISLSLVYSY
jgi:hypothetical protein